MIARMSIVGLVSVTLVCIAAAAVLRFGHGWMNSPAAQNDEIVPDTPAVVSSDRVVPAIEFQSPAAAVAELHARSPFDPLRRQFEPVGSEIPEAPPPPPPRLLGITGSGEGRRAIVEWPGSGATESLGVGAETPIGVVADVSDSSITIGHQENEIVLTLFD